MNWNINYPSYFAISGANTGWPKLGSLFASLFKRIEGHNLTRNDGYEINTNAFIPFICHCEPEALHHMVFRAKGVAILSRLGLQGDRRNQSRQHMEL